MTLLTSQELSAILRAENEDAILFVGGDSYQLPTTAWVLGKFSEDLRRFEFVNNMQQYREATNCCRHFAHAAMFVAAKCQDDAKSEHSLAFGFCSYLRLSDGLKLGGHAINFFVTVEVGKPVVKFYEPQTYALADLRPFELTTIKLMQV